MFCKSSVLGGRKSCEIKLFLYWLISSIKWLQQAKWAVISLRIKFEKSLSSWRAIFKSTSRRTEIPNLSLLRNITYYIYIFTKLRDPAILASFITAEKVYFNWTYWNMLGHWPVLWKWIQIMTVLAFWAVPLKHWNLWICQH